jgi:hypothetical protein
VSLVEAKIVYRLVIEVFSVEAPVTLLYMVLAYAMTKSTTITIPIRMTEAKHITNVFLCCQNMSRRSLTVNPTALGAYIIQLLTTVSLFNGLMEI